MNNRSGVEMLFQSSASSHWLKKQKHYQTPGIKTMVHGSESLFLRSCHRCLTFLCDDVAEQHNNENTLYHAL